MTNVVNEMRKKSLELMIIALGFVAGGVWKDAIVEWLKPLTETGEGAVPLTIAALVTTAVAVLLILVLTKVLGEKEEEKK